MTQPGDASFMDRVGQVVQEVSAEVIEPRFAALGDDEVRTKSPGEIVTVADEEAEELLRCRLSDLLPGVPVVGEEAASLDPSLVAALAGHSAWLVDPLDGTANFVAGSQDWAVMIALVDQGTTVASWIWRPVGQVMYMAALGEGATRNGAPFRRTDPTPPLSAMRGVAETRFLNDDIANRTVTNRHRFRSVGNGRKCAGVDYPALIEGDQEFVLYWRTLPWDHAPGALLLQEAGGAAARLDGTPYAPTQNTTGLLLAADRAAWRTICDALLGH